MITAAVAIVDPDSGTLELANAAHLAPIVVDASGGSRFLDVPGDLPLGLGRPGGYRTLQTVLEPGASLVLYTDGLVEQRGRSLTDTLEEFRVHAASAPRTGGAGDIASHLAAFRDAVDGSEDDAAVLVVRRPG